MNLAEKLALKEFQVWHLQKPSFLDDPDPKPVFPDEYILVALVDAADLEQVYELTNHIDKPWWENAGVTLRVKSRSTSIGDVVKCCDGTFVCKSIGWEPL